ncbi:hypothetical protein KQH69_07210 [Streptococcus sanguinis]|nr:hypothetical protein [Streptococcus sanguinis]
MKVVIPITEEMIRIARDYSELSHDYTSRAHDFHEGGADIASQKMYEGKLGEQAFAVWLKNEGIEFTEDRTSHDEADKFDFIVKGYKIDVKTRTEDYQTRTLEMVEQFYKRPKDIYVGARLYRDKNEVELYGIISANKLKKLGQIEKFGYKEDFFAYDSQLSPIQLLKDLKDKNK